MEYVFSDKISSLQPSAIREILKAASPDVVPFSAGNPSAESFPVEDIKRISAEILAEQSSEALQYGITEGYTPLRETVKKRMADVYLSGNDSDDLIIVSGAQQGIELTCKVLCNEGDTVICETPSFIGALNSFRSYNVRLCGVPLENDGICIEKLEQALKTQKNVRFIYIIPTFQNPTGVVTSLEKRKAVYALAQKYNVMILEDSPYVDLRFAGEEVPMIKSLDTDGRVICCGTFSKILSAGIRVGYALAPHAVAQKMVVAKQVADVHTNLFFQILAYRFMTECDLNAHIDMIRRLYRRKSGLLMENIEKRLPYFKFIRPQGGLFLWCMLPEGTDVIEYCKKAKDNGVAVVPGFAFAVSPTESFCAVRLNYSTPSDEQIVEGVKRLSKIKI